MIMRWLRASLDLDSSSRLHFTHVSFYIAASCVMLNAAQSWTAISFFTICCILYMFKDIDKLKFSAKEQSVEIEDSEVKNEQEQK